MKKISVSIIILLASVLIQQQTFAQATRTWVSGVGDDVNPCSRTAPCKTFAGAISKTAAGGEINIIDAGAFGAVTITKSITIDGKGLEAGILATSNTAGITINAAATDVIILRNLDIHGGTAGTPGSFGVRYLSARHVVIEDCKITNFGVNIETYPTTSNIYVDVAAKANLTVKNTTMASLSSTVTGLYIRTASATDTAVAVLDNVNIHGIGTAIFAKESAHVNVLNSVLSDNYRAVYSEFSTSVVRLSNTSILHNTIGIGTGPGKVFSYGNNLIAGNLQSVPLGVASSQ